MHRVNLVAEPLLHGPRLFIDALVHSDMIRAQQTAAAILAELNDSIHSELYASKKSGETGGCLQYLYRAAPDTIVASSKSHSLVSLIPS
ncbi:unnamed protein product [Protopolystoma xenopodis]|uniref:Uncharacterized protein n=1 Tax=Protopolystoma xenopodis TaxID=117903 RepID=A0A3S5BT46_9PLAT|nr:unnamed protein product [Protopolystoma xenopodis]